MDTITVNYWAISGRRSPFNGYGGNLVWPRIRQESGWKLLVLLLPRKTRKKMQKAAGPLYVVQFLLTLFQVLVLAHLIADTTRVGGIERSLWIWAAFVIPTLAGGCNVDERKRQIKMGTFSDPGWISAGALYCVWLAFTVLEVTHNIICYT